MTPEFPRPQRLDHVGVGESHVTITAEPAERVALARRFDLQALDRLESTFTLRREGDGIIARGHLSAKVVQACVVTGDPVPARVEEDFAIHFVPEPTGLNEGEEVELSDDALDTVFYSGNAIDLGEAAAETLALALDPYPRSPAAGDALKAAGVISEEEAGPFGALASLKDKLAGR